ncbi:GTP 3',8-cyclase MoaA [Alienimonas chondri]|uniref:GTP 3',8-cyclase n=1 Tax=Alienimonas chondri TaxID=2681879 RepID=A0ABX1V7P0_9PLAN|nr:GTP 3',8-cyclase MoaA [Alienimonas chondri]NNJ24234.1 GTP 3',8-cyclase [Alienimonas chondri]
MSSLLSPGRTQTSGPSLPVIDATSLTDRHARTFRSLRVSLTPACNFACVYCRPADHRTFQHGSDLLSLGEIARTVGVAAQLGFRKVRLTGGEPLVRPHVPDLVADLKSIPGIEQVALTTNGSLLPKHAARLKSAGLDRVNVSLDSLDREATAKLAGRDVLDEVLAGLDAAAAAELPVKLNVVPVRGVNDHETLDLASYGAERGWEVRFIEYMPMGRVASSLPDATVPSAELRERLAERFDLHLDPAVPASDPARGWVCRRTGARVGFISSLTEHFCAACDRMRLTAEGQLRPCLHQDAGVNLRDPLRDGADDAALAALFKNAANQKWAGHEMTAATPRFSDRDMISLGG